VHASVSPQHFVCVERRWIPNIVQLTWYTQSHSQLTWFQSNYLNQGLAHNISQLQMCPYFMTRSQCFF